MAIKENSNKNWRWFLLALIPVAAIFVRVLLPTGTWECYNGDWVKRGRPGTAQPTTPCRPVTSSLGELIASAESVLENFNSETVTAEASKFAASEKEATAIILQTPKAGDLISSPLTVTGLAPADWFYQGELLITLEDSERQVIAKHFGSKQPGNTTVPNYNSFSAWIDFETDASIGYLVVYKNNLSATAVETGDQSQRWPIIFD